MALFSKNTETILKESIDSIIANTKINSISPGSKMFSLLSVLKNEIGNAYSDFDYNTMTGLIHGARGRDLDYLGDLVGLRRREEEPSYADKGHNIIKFYLEEEATENISIPMGTKIYTDPSNGVIHEFIVSADEELEAGTKEVFVSVKSISPVLNDMFPLNVSRHSLSNKNLKVQNISSILRGIERESDENFKYRIANHRLSASTANETAMRISALSVYGVADVEIFTRHFGVGTTVILVKSITPKPSKDLIAKVQLAVDKVKADGTKVTVIAPHYLEMRFIITLNFNNGSSDKDRYEASIAARSAVIDYVNSLDIGEGFSVNRLSYLIIGSHKSIKSTGIPNRLIDNIFIRKTVRDKFIEIEVISDYTPSEFQKIVMLEKPQSIIFNG